MGRLVATAGVAAFAAVWWAGVIGGQPRADPADGLRIANRGRTQLDDFRVRDGAVTDDDTVILVGATDGPEEADDPDLEPNGWVIDLRRKTPARRFTNGHAAPLTSISVGHGMVVTTSTTLDPVLRVCRLGSFEPVASVTLGEKRQDSISPFAARWLHKTPHLAVFADKHVQVFDPKAPAARTHYRLGPKVDAWLFARLAVSPDDTRIACTAKIQRPGLAERLAGVVVWGADRDNPVAVPVVPQSATDPQNWFAWDVAIGKTGDVIARRSNTQIEIPKGTAEKDVPPERRGVVRIDADRAKAVPTKMGVSVGTLGCAFDPTGKWLTAVGTAHPDGPEPDDGTFASELRVYEATTARLVHREQVFARQGVSWVGFSPSGKRLCAASANGTLFWWDVERP